MDMAQALTNQNRLSKSLRQGHGGPRGCEAPVCILDYGEVWGSLSRAVLAGSGKREYLGAQTIAILISGSYWLNSSFTNQHKKTFSRSPEIQEMQIKIAIRSHFHTSHWQGDVCPDSPFKEGHAADLQGVPSADSFVQGQPQLQWEKWDTKTCISPLL